MVPDRDPSATLQIAWALFLERVELMVDLIRKSSINMVGPHVRKLYTDSEIAAWLVLTEYPFRD
jgi:hypothetical protein